MIEAVLFDLDGTLADTAPDLGGALNRLLLEEGRVPLPMPLLRPHVSGGARALIGAGFGLTPESADYLRLKQRFLELYEQHICVDSRLFDGMSELLANIEAAKLRWGIVTNKIERYTRQVVAGLGLEQRADCVVSGDSTPNPKPHPEPMLLACRLAGVNPQHTLYIGDDLRDVQAGHAAGIRTIAAAWGYLGEGLPIEQWKANGIAVNPADVPRLIKAAC